MPLAGNNRGKDRGHSGGAERAAMHYTLLLPFAFPKVLAKEQERGEQQTVLRTKTDRDKETQSK